MTKVIEMIRFLLLGRFGSMIGVFVWCIVVGTLSSGGYCEDCSNRAPGVGQMVVGLIYAAASIYALIKAREWVSQRNPTEEGSHPR